MSGPGGPAAAPRRLPGGPARRPGRRRPDGHGHGHAAGEGRRDFRALVRAAARRAAARSGRSIVARHRCSPSSASSFAVVGPKILGEATNVIFAGAVGSASCPPASTHGPGHRRPARQRPGPARRHARDAGRRPGRGHRLRARSPRSSPSLAVRLPAELALRLGAGLHHGRRHPADRLPAPRARSTRSSAGCRSPTSTATPRGDILSRVTNDIDNISQSLQQSADPAHHVAADRRRRADHDAHDQPAARA